MLQIKRKKRTQGAREEKDHRIFSRVVMPVAFAAIVIYLIFSAWAGIRDPYTFVMTYEGTMEDGFRASGWIVRQETPIPGGDGMVQMNLIEGEKIGRGQPLGVLYQSAEYEQNQKALNQTRVDLGALQYATYDGSPKGAALDDQLLSAMKTVRMMGSSGACGDVTGQADTFRKLVLRREFLVNAEAVGEMYVAADALYAKMDELQNAQNAATEITAETSGIFCGDLDGYETLLTPDVLDGIMPEDLSGFSRLIPKADPTALGKLVSSWRWYYAVSVSDEEAKRFSVGGRVSIQFDAVPKALPMTVESVSENQNKRAVVVLRSAENLELIEGLREESCLIVFESDEGLVIPKEALRVLEDGSTVVYTVSGYLAAMKPVTVLAENSHSYLVEPGTSEGKEILRSGDEVILASAELYDGKVVR